MPSAVGQLFVCGIEIGRARGSKRRLSISRPRPPASLGAVQWLLMLMCTLPVVSVHFPPVFLTVVLAALDFEVDVVRASGVATKAPDVDLVEERLAFGAAYLGPSCAFVWILG